MRHLPTASASFLLGLLFDTEEGGDIFLQTSGFHLRIKRYNPEARTLHSNRCENFKSNETEIQIYTPYIYSCLINGWQMVNYITRCLVFPVYSKVLCT
jgi:hypothetical protein